MDEETLTHIVATIKEEQRTHYAVAAIMRAVRERGIDQSVDAAFNKAKAAVDTMLGEGGCEIYMLYITTATLVEMVAEVIAVQTPASRDEALRIIHHIAMMKTIDADDKLKDTPAQGEA